MSLQERLSDTGLDPLACLLWGISFSAFGLIMLNDQVHAELMLLCVDGSRTALAEGLAYLRLVQVALDFRALAGGTLLMLIAMMTPALAGPLLHLWFRSLSRHRWRAITLFFLGYFMVWLSACAMLFIVALTLVSLTGSEMAAAGIALTACLLWQSSALRARCLTRCHLRPRLSIFGLMALVDPLFFGVRHGFWCVTACWALMLIPMCVADWHVPLMLLATVLVAYERTKEPARKSLFA